MSIKPRLSRFHTKKNVYCLVLPSSLIMDVPISEIHAQCPNYTAVNNTSA